LAIANAFRRRSPLESPDSQELTRPDRLECDVPPEPALARLKTRGGYMPPAETEFNDSAPTFRLDVPLHSLLTQPGSRTAVPPPVKPEPLPVPVFP
jgi:hypothetical protein